MLPFDERAEPDYHTPPRGVSRVGRGEPVGVVQYAMMVIAWKGLDADADLGVSSSPMARKADGRLEVVATDNERTAILVALFLTTGGLCAVSVGVLGRLLTR